MKKLIVAAAFVLSAASAQAAMAPAPELNASVSDIQPAGIICGHGFHLAGVVCVRNAPMMRVAKVCPPGWHLGPEGLRCRRN